MWPWCGVSLWSEDLRRKARGLIATFALRWSEAAVEACPSDVTIYDVPILPLGGCVSYFML
jgi:hypothetical protein